MELRQLRHFEEVVRAASFGQAAERLNITQPALSKSIRNLELSLDVTLLERHPSGVCMTDFGELFLTYASLVNNELQRATEHLAEMKGMGRGTVRVGAGATLTKYLLGEVVSRFTDGQDQYSLVFRQGLREELFALLRQGEIDVMIGSMVRGGADPEMRAEPVFEDALGVVADQSHPLVGRANLTLADLASYRWILPEGEAEGDRLARAFRKAKLTGPNSAVRTASSAYMAQWLKGSNFLSYLPLALIAQSGDYDHLVPIKVAEPIWQPVPIVVYYRKRGVMLQSTRRFINRVKEIGADIAGRLATA